MRFLFILILFHRGQVCFPDAAPSERCASGSVNLDLARPTDQKATA